jgi:iron complex outermembrane recepter protein
VSSTNLRNDTAQIFSSRGYRVSSISLIHRMKPSPSSMTAKQSLQRLQGYVMRLSVVSAAVCICLVGISIAGNVRASIRKEVNIPAEGLGPALQTLAKQRGFQIIYIADDVDALKTKGVSGNLTSEEALGQVLKGTGLTYRIYDDNSVGIVPLAAGGSSTSPPPTGLGAIPAPPQIYLAQAQTTPVSADQAVPVEESAKDASKKEGLEEIVVTGTHISGGAPVGSPLITVTATDIANSGYSTVGDVIRSIPQAFGGGINPGVLGAGGATNNQNASSSSTVNLRGLGSDSTLTLVDGHRLSFDGITSSVDISSIPLAAIDRIEILTDSASAIYGSDAVAGVANFILKKNYEGAQTTATFGEANGGAAKEYDVSQLLGTNWAGGNAMLSYEHYRQDALYASQRSFSDAAADPLTLLPRQSRDSVFGSVRQSFGEAISAYSEFLYSDRTADVDETVLGLGGGTFYTDTTATQFALSSGVSAKLAREWTLSLDGTASRSKDNSTNNDVYLEGPASNFPFYYANRTDSVEADAAGPLLTLPSGPLKTAIGLGYESQEYHDDTGLVATRNIDYGFAELNVPVARADPERVGLERLDLSIAGRYEHYSDFGSSTTPKFGVAYVPVGDLTLRGTWGKSFRAPDLETEFSQTELLVFPASDFGGEFGSAASPHAQGLEFAGANPLLRPETARSWTTGFDYSPSWIPPLRVNLTYFNIDYRNRIATPTATAVGVIGNPIYAPFVTLNPSPALQAALVARSNLFTNLTGTTYDPASVVALFDDQYQNAAEQHASGFDLTGDYRVHSSFGDFDLTANAAWLKLTEAFTPTSPETTLSGTIFNPPRFKARLGATWQRGSWSAASFVNYVSTEIDNTNFEAPVNVASWTTVDAQWTYAVPSSSGFLHGIHISASVQNLFNRNPPPVNGASTFIESVGYDSTNSSPLGRFGSLTLRKDW